MGRYDLRPLRVHHTATQLLATEKISSSPPWYDVITSVPPSETLVRTQPLQHQNQSRSRQQKIKKPSKSFRPQRIVYEEDALRKEFFGDHPWELARPRVVLESDGRDREKCDWSKLQQDQRALSGESVIQRQLWLLHQNDDKSDNPKMTQAQAYDQARKEFYELRLQEDVQRRVAQEEAISTGAYFGKSVMDVGMELEDKEFERWKLRSEKETEIIEQRQAAMYTGDPGEPGADDGNDELEATLEELDRTAPDPSDPK